MIDNDISAKMSICASAGGEDALRQLTELLELQISLAKQGKLDEIDSLADRIEQLLDAACDCAASQRYANMAERIQSLHRELCLILEAERADLGARLKKFGKGKKFLRGYHDALDAS